MNFISLFRKLEAIYIKKHIWTILLAIFLEIDTVNKFMYMVLVIFSSEKIFSLKSMHLYNCWKHCRYETSFIARVKPEKQ